ncbi:tetratricopeptide repeat protein [Oceaniglobus ichthyenteri]|uniref:tetratricopeptide repeat protein n=1 Tax=Oceaniglobus ichthyenteri TaxID=2136177 RepID=UPI000D3B4159|nr:tetratricopeptide repeat protein [Oceaniglobus ichthyenteri]
MRTRAVLALTLFLTATSGSAQDYETARQAYINGDYADALAVLEPLARAGDPEARNILADAYDDGNGVTRDHQRALELYRSAAAQGLAKASYNLGVLLAEGRPGIPADIAQAIVHYHEAMAKDYPAAFNNRGILHAKGQGGPVDPAAAVALYQRAHTLGDLNGTDNLADMLRRGDGVAKDEAAALALWRGAAERGHGPAMNNLGAMYANGIVVEQDAIAAQALYLLAAQTGSVQGGMNLSDLYAIKGDDLHALAWCLWAVERGSEAECGAKDDAMWPPARALAARLTP